MVMVALAADGCGGGSSGEAKATSPGGSSESYLPLTVGTVWTYAITAASGATGQGTAAVEAAEPAPGAGQPALRVHTVLLDGAKLSWEQSSGSAVVRFEEKQLDQSGAVIVDKQYAPPILVLDEAHAHLTAGASWTERYSETKSPSAKGKASHETVEWTVEAVADTVKVPAGTYSCIRIRRNHTSSKTPSDTVSWYARGVGKVRETGAGSLNDQTLELAAVQAPQ
jgi:hypothetical protein